MFKRLLAFLVGSAFVAVSSSHAFSVEAANNQIWLVLKLDAVEGPTLAQILVGGKDVDFNTCMADAADGELEGWSNLGTNEVSLEVGGEGAPIRARPSFGQRKKIRRGYKLTGSLLGLRFKRHSSGTPKFNRLWAGLDEEENTADDPVENFSVELGYGSGGPGCTSGLAPPGVYLDLLHESDPAIHTLGTCKVKIGNKIYYFQC